MRGIAFSILLLGVGSWTATLGAQETVSAELGKTEAWTGEALPLTITLRSPGPFSGTPSFDIPKLPKTAVLRMGRPVVGSEEIGGESYFTQRYEFRTYTQQSGEITIPPFRIRFEGKRSFTSDPEPMEGMTPELTFRSKRPPGTENLDVVVATREMDVSQIWSPANVETVQAGDVVQRTITRRSTGTTAMMFSPVGTEAPGGVRVYLEDPVVVDKTARGESTAERTETIKYQFERAGTFALPELRFQWWHPEKGELQEKVLPGETITVEGVASASDAEARTHHQGWRMPVIFILAAGLLFGFGRKPLGRRIAVWKAKRNRPEAVAARRVLRACRSNEARAAHSGLLAWERASLPLADLEGAEFEELRSEWSALSRLLFQSEKEDEKKWSGKTLGSCFRLAHRRFHQLSNLSHRKSRHLPPLNPI